MSEATRQGLHRSAPTYVPDVEAGDHIVVRDDDWDGITPLIVTPPSLAASGPFTVEWVLKAQTITFSPFGKCWNVITTWHCRSIERHENDTSG